MPFFCAVCPGSGGAGCRQGNGGGMVVVVADGFEPDGGAGFGTGFDGDVGEGGAGGGAVPVFDVGGDFDDVAGLEDDGGFAAFLVAAFSGGAQQDLAARVAVPVVAAAGVEGDVDDGAVEYRVWLDEPLEPYGAAEFAAFDGFSDGEEGIGRCGHGGFLGWCRGGRAGMVSLVFFGFYRNFRGVCRARFVRSGWDDGFTQP